ncbi:hypothetical protein V1524DRAFT_435233 [Lipomyces starkeyi]
MTALFQFALLFVTSAAAHGYITNCWNSKQQSYVSVYGRTWRADLSYHLNVSILICCCRIRLGSGRSSGSQQPNLKLSPHHGTHSHILTMFDV